MFDKAILIQFKYKDSGTPNTSTIGPSTSSGSLSGSTVLTSSVIAGGKMEGMSFFFPKIFFRVRSISSCEKVSRISEFSFLRLPFFCEREIPFACSSVPKLFFLERQFVQPDLVPLSQRKQTNFEEVVEKLRLKNLEYAMFLAELDATLEDEYKLYLVRNYVECVSRFSPKYVKISEFFLSCFFR